MEWIKQGWGVCAGGGPVLVLERGTSAARAIHRLNKINVWLGNLLSLTQYSLPLPIILYKYTRLRVFDQPSLSYLICRYITKRSLQPDHRKRQKRSSCCGVKPNNDLPEEPSKIPKWLCSVQKAKNKGT